MDKEQYLKLNTEIWNWLNIEILTLADYQFLEQSVQLELTMIQKKIKELKKKGNNIYGING